MAAFVCVSLWLVAAFFFVCYSFYDCPNAKCIANSIAQNISHAAAVDMHQIGIYFYENEGDSYGHVLDQVLRHVPGPVIQAKLRMVMGMGWESS